VHSPILDAQERPQTSQGKLADFKYVPVFRCSRLVYSVRTRPASNCWTEVLQCDRQSDRSSARSSSSGGAMSQRFKLPLYRFRCPPREPVPSSNSLQKMAFGNHPCAAHGQSSQVEPQSRTPRCQLCYRSAGPRCLTSFRAIWRVPSVGGNACGHMSRYTTHVSDP